MLTFAFKKFANKLFVTLLFFAFTVLASGIAFAGKTDSLKARLAAHTKDDTVRAKLISEVAVSYSDINQDSMLYYAHEGLKLSYKLNYDYGKASSMRQIGVVYFHKNEYEKSINYTKEALRLFEKIGDKTSQASMLRFIADIQYRLTNYPLAIEYYNKCIAIAEPINDYANEGLALINIGGIYTDQSNHVEAVNYYLKGLKVFEKAKDNRGISMTLINLGTSYSAIGNHKMALEYINKALPINDAITEKEVAFANIVNIGVVYTDFNDYQNALKAFRKGEILAKAIGDETWIVTCQGNIADVFFHLEQYDSAYIKFQPVLAKSKELNDTTMIVMSQAGIGSILVKKNKPKEGIQLLLPILDIARNKQMKQYIYDIANELSQAYEKLGDYPQALKYHKIYYNYRDSLNNEKNDKHIQQLQFDYQLEKKENQIELQNKNMIISQSKNEEQRVVMLALLGGLILVIIVSMLLYRNIRLEKRNQEKLLKQKEEIQLQASKLEELVKFKDKTFSVLSHDLRGPMGTLTTAMMLLDEYIISPDEFSKIKPEINNQLNSLNNLLDNLLNWARSSIQGEIIAKPVEIDLKGIIDQSISLLKESAQRKSLTIQVNIPAYSKCYCDPGQADIVLRNIISNAIKFTPQHGSINISATTTGNKVSIAIQDTGVGMNEEQISKLFRATANNNTYGTVGEKGTGLGLLLCYEFIKGNGGNIFVTSELKKGSTFTIELPVDGR